MRPLVYACLVGIAVLLACHPQRPREEGGASLRTGQGAAYLLGGGLVERVETHPGQAIHRAAPLLSSPIP